MTAVTNIFKTNPLANLFRNDGDELYYVIHPLDDEPEVKCDPESLGAMKLSKAGRLSLIVLQGYLVLMLALAAYRVADLAGMFGPHLVR